MNSSESFSSILLGLCSVIGGIFVITVLNKKANNPYLLVLGLGLLLVGLICFQPILDFVFTGIRFIFVTGIILVLIVVAWKSLTAKDKKVPDSKREIITVSRNEKVDNNLPNSPSYEVQELIPDGIDKRKKRWEIYDDEINPYYYDDIWRKVIYEFDQIKGESHTYYYDEKGNKIINYRCSSK